MKRRGLEAFAAINLTVMNSTTRHSLGSLLMCSLCLRTGVVFVQLTFNDHTHNMLFAVWHFKFKFSPCAAYLNRQQQLLLTVQTQHNRRRRQSRTHTTGNAPITPHSLTTDYDLLQRCGKTIHCTPFPPVPLPCLDMKWALGQNESEPYPICIRHCLPYDVLCRRCQSFGYLQIS